MDGGNLLGECLGGESGRRQARMENFKAVVQAKVELLCETHWKHYSLHNGVVLLEEMINLHYN